MAPEGIVHAADVDGDQGQRNAEEVDREKELIVLLRLAREYVVYGRHEHAQAEADEQADDQHLVAQLGVFAQELKVEDGQSDEEDAASQVTPDVDLPWEREAHQRETLVTVHYGWY